MKATQQLHDLGQSLWLDNITRDMLDSGTLKRYIDELSVTGLTSNPTIFDHAMTHGNSYDDEIGAAHVKRHFGRGRFLRDGDRRLAPRGRLVRRHPPADFDRRRLGVAGGFAAARLRRQDDGRSREDAAPEGRPPQSVHQDSRHSRRTNRHRRSNLCRRLGQRHAAVQPRSLSGRGRRLHARAGAPRRSRSQPRCSLGRVAVRQPLGQGDDGQGACRSARQTRPGNRRSRPTRPTATCSIPTAGSVWRILARVRSACSSPAPEPKIPRLPTCFISARWPRPTPSTPCRRKRCWRLASMASVGKPIPRDGGDCEQVLSAFSKAGIDVAKLAADLQSEGAKSFVDSWKDLLKSIETKSKALK